MRAIGHAEVLDDFCVVDCFRHREAEAALGAVIEDVVAAADATRGGKRLNNAGARSAGIRRSEEPIGHPEIVGRSAIKVAETTYGAVRLVR